MSNGCGSRRGEVLRQRGIIEGEVVRQRARQAGDSAVIEAHEGQEKVD